MKEKLNISLNTIEPSKIRAFNNYAIENSAKYFLTLGEPDFDSLSSVKEATINAINQNETHYAHSNGLLALRKAISEFEFKLNKVKYDENEILITHGSTSAVSVALQTVMNEDDEVIVPTPAYPLYKSTINFYKGKYIPLDTTINNFEISKEMLNSVLSNKTKAIIITTPNNPTGHILSDDSLNNIYEFAKENNVFVICDDCYNQLVYGERRLGFSKYQDIKDRIVVCQSFSKSYAMTGYRLGYMMADNYFIVQASKINQNLNSCLNTFVQIGAIKALDENPEFMIKDYKERRDYTFKRLKEMGFDINLPEGAFYLFPSIKKYNMDSLTFCKKLVDSKKVAIIPGMCFEADDFVRISYCVNKDVLSKSLDLIQEFINKLNCNHN